MGQISLLTYQTYQRRSARPAPRVAQPFTPSPRPPQLTSLLSPRPNHPPPWPHVASSQAAPPRLNRPRLAATLPLASTRVHPPRSPRHLPSRRPHASTNPTQSYSAASPAAPPPQTASVARLRTPTPHSFQSTQPIIPQRPFTGLNQATKAHHRTAKPA